ncbi:MAG: radical SAM protein [Oscillospiraceae bacterium]|jgi:MoaA/NifB/PqqE/SkfB family radical SAM enzyme|nr:radical SAM protein [Oscillospiraceae bacterium]
MEVTKTNDGFMNAIHKQAMDTNTPIYAIFELTGRCNFDCKMCYVHVLDAVDAKKKELSTQQWLTVFDSAYEKGLLFATLTGGECLLRKDFRQLYLHLWNKGVKLTVFTNGALVTDDYVAFFAKYRPEKIQISLYGSNDDGYEAVTGKRAFKKVEDAILKLKEVRIPLSLAVTRSRFMEPHFAGILQYIKAGRYSFDVNPALFATRDSIEREDYWLTEDGYVASEREYRRIMGVEIVPNAVVPEAGGGGTEVGVGLPCTAGRIRPLVTWDGHLTPCQAIPEPRVNLLEHSYSEAWEIINKAVREAHTPMECKGCAYEKQCTVCPAIRGGGLSCDHCKPEQCALTKRLYAEGLIKI